MTDWTQKYGQKTSKMPPKWGFSPICDPSRFFFKNWTQSLLYTYGALTSCKKLDKTNELSLRYLKTDTHTDRRTHGQGRLLRTPTGKPGVQNSKEIHPKKVNYSRIIDNSSFFKMNLLLPTSGGFLTL